jgi:O-methyltransferase involved in polyketide biosynthesis
VAAYDFERISITAFGPVAARGEYTNIPFAKEILSYLQERSLVPEREFPARLERHAPFFEARFKAVSRILFEQHATQIIELASGFSPRGLDPAFQSTVYVEVDLPKMITLKREIVTALLGSIPSHHKFCCASVLDRDEFAQSTAHFRKQPVAVTSEGLLRYLTFDEKAQLAENVRSILDAYGGVWITPDIHLREWAPENKRPSADWGLDARLGRDLNVNYFNDLAHARSFFEGCGFEVEERPILEGVREQVVSLRLAPPDQLAELEDRKVFTLRVRS